MASGIEDGKVMLDFKEWCVLPSVHNVVDGMQICIPKPNIFFAQKIIIFIKHECNP
jgi:hypothetical protein